MLSLIIADDEKMTRDSLKEYIPWAELGIGRVETAKNGLVALELAQLISPDIIITDVRMPKMDGIEFATRVRELLPDSKIIFLSGYSDKEYLKSAIHLKAVNYIEKPVNLDEIKTVVRETVALCMSEYKKKALTLPLIRQEIASGLVRENADLQNLMEKYDDPFLKQAAEGNTLSALCILLNWKPSAEPEMKDRIRQNITELICSDTFGDHGSFIAGFVENDRIAFIMAGEGRHPAVLEKFAEVSEGCFSVSVGVGIPAGKPDLLAKSYSEAVKAAKRQFYQGVNRIFLAQKESGRHYEIRKNFYSLFRDCMKKDNKTAALSMVEDLTRQIRECEDPDTDHIKNIYFNILLHIFEIARERDLIDPAVEQENSYIWQEIDEIKTLSGLSDYTRSSVEAVYIRMEAKDAVNRKTYEVMKYIRDNYPDKRLSTRTIAESAYLSQTYLCSFFKKSTGKTLNEYITEIRIEKAKELLKDNRVKLYEIASNTGFTDTNYFSTLFKKYVGCTPSEFREKYYI